MNNFAVRTISGAVFAAVVIGMVVFHQHSLAALVLFLSAVGVYEFLKLQKVWNLAIGWLAVVLNILLVLSFAVESDIRVFTITIFASVALLSMLLALWKYGLKVHEVWQPVVFAMVYVSLPFSLFFSYATSGAEYDFKKALLVFFLVWSSDTFAYLTGRSFGKHALSKQLSPKKTWEGFLGGTILTGILGGVLSYFWHFFDIPMGVFLGMLASVFGTAGDLFESALKRNAGVKDSGNIIPGHGGVLDRFDAFIFVAVLVNIFDILQLYI